MRVDRTTATAATTPAAARSHHERTHVPSCRHHPASPAHVLAAMVATVATTASSASPRSAPRPGRRHRSQPTPATLYREALASTKDWYVHYSSSSTQSKVTLVESGNAGPASGTQKIHMGKNHQLKTTPPST